MNNLCIPDISFEQEKARLLPVLRAKFDKELMEELEATTVPIKFWSLLQRDKKVIMFVYYNFESYMNFMVAYALRGGTASRTKPGQRNNLFVGDPYEFNTNVCTAGLCQRV